MKKKKMLEAGAKRSTTTGGGGAADEKAEATATPPLLSRSPSPPAMKRSQPTDTGALSVHDRMEAIAAAVDARAADVTAQLARRGFFVVDGLLGDATAAALREEAEALQRLGFMVPSQSTRWNAEVGQVEAYEKHNVLSMQLEGGELQYGVAPRLVEYTATLTQSLAPRVAAAFPDAAPLNESVQTNKLAVCLGDGSAYDKHIDNQGGDDRRKLTVLYYMNDYGGSAAGGVKGEGGGYREAGRSVSEREAAWAASGCGGAFRAFCDPSDPEAYEDVAPIADRLFGFWSDALVHAVMPSQVRRPGSADHRFALTVWLCVDDPCFIAFDPPNEAAHF